VALQIRAIDHVILRVRDMRAMRRFCSFDQEDPEGNVIELKGPSDGKGPPAG
jgi:hypothetical protein